MPDVPPRPRMNSADRPAKRYPEISASSLAFGLLFGIILNAAITYSGLKIGFTTSGSAIAAVVGFGVLRGLLRRGTILEVNIAQTSASAVNIPTAGVIFTVPVLFLLGMPFGFSDRNFWLLLIAATVGTVLGVVFIIPVRKQMIDIDRLRFPSATAVGAILKSPGAGTAKTIVLLAGILVAMLVYLPAALPSIRLPVKADRLEELEKRGVITSSQREVTKSIAEWIEIGGAPASMVTRGKVVHDARTLHHSLVDEAAKAGKAFEPTEELTALEAHLEELRKDSTFNDELALATYRVAGGEIEMKDLRKRAYGWATAPLWGYSNLDVRLSAPTKADPNNPADIDRYEREMKRVDRDGDGKPDLVVSTDKVNVGRWLGLPDEIELIMAIAPFALGAGFLTGRAGLTVLAGGILAYFFITPFAFNQQWMPQNVNAPAAPGYAFLNFNRPLGIGLLLGGALMGIVMSLPSIKEAFKSIAHAHKTKGGSEELGLRTLVAAALLAGIGLFIAAELIHSGSTAPPSGLLAQLGLAPWIRHAIVALVGVAWMWFAGIIIAQCVGMTDWSPISAMSLLTVVLVMALAGTADTVGAVLIGCALCCAISCASDMMQDLRTGHLVGAKPMRQQVVELVGVIIGPAIALCTLMLIVNANLAATDGAHAIGPGTDTAAAQAQALEAVMKGVQGGEMPYALFGTGAALGVLLGLGAFPGLGVLVGLSMILPFYYILTYGVGCVLNIAVSAIKGKRWAEEWGVPFSAGLIVGEALLALVINGIVLVMS